MPPINNHQPSLFSPWNNVQSYVVISKHHLSGDAGTLRLPSGESLRVKKIPHNIAEIDPEMISPKMLKWLHEGRLGAIGNDGEIRFHTDVAKHLNVRITVVITNNPDQIESTHDGEVKVISDESYAALTTFFTILQQMVDSVKKEQVNKHKKEKPTNSASKVHFPGHLSSFVRKVPFNVMHDRLAAKMNQYLIHVLRSFERKRHAREEERAEQHKQLIREDIQHDIKNWEIKQEELKKQRIDTQIVTAEILQSQT